MLLTSSPTGGSYGAHTAVADSPYIVRVAPGAPCVRRCSVAGAGARAAAAGHEASFDVAVRDEWGNLCGVDQVPMLLQLQVGGLAWQ